LQLGDLEQAEKVFKNVEDMVKKHPEHSHFKLQLIMNKYVELETNSFIFVVNSRKLYF